MKKVFLLIGLVLALLAATMSISTSSAKAGAWAGECWVYQYPINYSTCGIPWNYWRTYQVVSYNNATIYFASVHPNGDLAGGYGYVPCCGGYRWFHASGYNKAFVWNYGGPANPARVYVYATTDYI